jgi:hypothetical protein
MALYILSSKCLHDLLFGHLLKGFLRCHILGVLCFLQRHIPQTLSRFA